MLTWWILYDELMNIFFELVFFFLVSTLSHRWEESWHVAAIFIQIRCPLILPVSWLPRERGLGSILSHRMWRLLCLFNRFLLLSRFEIGVFRNIEGWCRSLMMSCRWEKFEGPAILLMVSGRSTFFDINFDRACGRWRDNWNASRTLCKLLLYIHCHLVVILA